MGNPPYLHGSIESPRGQPLAVRAETDRHGHLVVVQGSDAGRAGFQIPEPDPTVHGSRSQESAIRAEAEHLREGLLDERAADHFTGAGIPEAHLVVSTRGREQPSIPIDGPVLDPIVMAGWLL